MTRFREKQDGKIKLMCRIFGHKMIVKHGDCYFATSERVCVADAVFDMCLRGDYKMMRNHEPIWRKVRRLGE
jgi:hypothetical protein